MRLVVCDDDPSVRSAVGVIAEEHGHTVIAETDNALEALQLTGRFNPDVLVLDLALRIGSGAEVLAELNGPIPDGPHVVVFSAYAEDLAPSRHVSVLDKSDYSTLGKLLDDLDGSRSHERLEERRGKPAVLAVSRPLGAVEDFPADFFAALTAAQPGDAVLGVTVVDRANIAYGALVPLAVTARKAVRAQDCLLRQTGFVVLLLRGGEPQTSAVVARRILRMWTDRSTVVFADAVLRHNDLPEDIYQGVVQRIKGAVSADAR
jgi:CheY-like chemotaxis protein